ncbi:hypothetical protein EIP91_000345 [Steccherinum ochraceum]|uniref:Uncharacterized protein n=1 Tax=Steccherinum ochraceum TaxID=92696 RepID=A0A4R0RU08_9APHY|nr:hypothetical protein EIP91_000345 [Steccherinum ochraceum]
MLGFLVNRPNLIPTLQRTVQAHPGPVHRRLPRSNVYLNAYYATFALGMGGWVYGAYSLIFGKPAGPRISYIPNAKIESNRNQFIVGFWDTLRVLCEMYEAAFEALLVENRHLEVARDLAYSLRVRPMSAASLE